MKAFFTVLLILSGLVLTAQDYLVGIRVGPTINGASRGLENHQFVTGYSSTLLVDYDEGNFGINFELGQSKRGFKFSRNNFRNRTENHQYEFNYLELGAKFQWKLDYEDYLYFRSLIGFKLGTPLSANSTVNTEGVPSSGISSTSFEYDIRKQLRIVDVAISMGIECGYSVSEFYVIFTELSWQRSLLSIGNELTSDIIAANSHKHVGVYLGLGIKRRLVFN